MTKIALLMAAGTFGLIATLPAQAATVTLKASLAGANETDGGDSDGSGSFTAEIDTETGDVCYVLSVSDIGTASAAHVHSGAAGKNGAPVIPVEVTGADEDLCIAEEPDLLKKIVASPSDYYVNVHTSDFPKGAIRGQLSAGN